MPIYKGDTKLGSGRLYLGSTELDNVQLGEVEKYKSTLFITNFTISSTSISNAAQSVTLTISGNAGASFKIVENIDTSTTIGASGFTAVVGTDGTYILNVAHRVNGSNAAARTTTYTISANSEGSALAEGLDATETVTQAAGPFQAALSVSVNTSGFVTTSINSGILGTYTLTPNGGCNGPTGADTTSDTGNTDTYYALGGIQRNGCGLGNCTYSVTASKSGIISGTGSITLAPAGFPNVSGSVTVAHSCLSNVSNCPSNEAVTASCSGTTCSGGAPAANTCSGSASSTPTVDGDNYTLNSAGGFSGQSNGGTVTVYWQATPIIATWTITCPSGMTGLVGSQVAAACTITQANNVSVTGLPTLSASGCHNSLNPIVCGTSGWSSNNGSAAKQVNVACHRCNCVTGVCTPDASCQECG